MKHQLHRWIISTGTVTNLFHTSWQNLLYLLCPVILQHFTVIKVQCALFSNMMILRRRVRRLGITESVFCWLVGFVVVESPDRLDPAVGYSKC